MPAAHLSPPLPQPRAVAAAPMGRLAFALVCATHLLSPSALHAQVLRCTDARTGAVTYTNDACPSGSSVREVEPRKTPEEIARERAQAAEALQRKQQQLQAESAAQAQEERQKALEERERKRAAQAAQPSAHDYAHSAACARSRRNLDVLASSLGSTYEDQARLEAAQRQMDLDCLGPEGYAEVEKARALRSEPSVPPVIVVPQRRPGYRPNHPEPSPTPPQKPGGAFQCDVFRCWDGKGNVYPVPR
ncbi:uncharacterized protein DUF4124 [Extensimonas vulgaris]|uniref:Uncharacterized protein DUF4124 n=2 Tax=Extensimonas vulgaris TaxID=1031594 RepID=A0A369AUA0_9BURK|nr:uncharacterized protein DUF4124 [Extensimonas vulgaris]TWI40700.1 uncharacterized protein DUF4124 [Extensimonas vulgaris]